MPTPEFDLDVKSMGVSLQSLEQLSKLYEASGGYCNSNDYNQS